WDVGDASPVKPEADALAGSVIRVFFPPLPLVGGFHLAPQVDAGAVVGLVTTPGTHVDHGFPKNADECEPIETGLLARLAMSARNRVLAGLEGSSRDLLTGMRVVG